MRKGVAVGVVITVGLATTPGCFGHECDGDVMAVPYGEAPAEGDFLDDATWESSPLQSFWLDFPGRRTWKFHIPKFERENRPFLTMTGYVSAGRSPDGVTECDFQGCPPADNWTNGTGNLLEFSQVSPGRFQVTNDTCSPFYLRVVMRAGPPSVDAGAGDASSE